MAYISIAIVGGRHRFLGVAVGFHVESSAFRDGGIAAQEGYDRSRGHGTTGSPEHRDTSLVVIREEYSQSLEEFSRGPVSAVIKGVAWAILNTTRRCWFPVGIGEGCALASPLA
jgi:hypothetical protein